MNDDLRLEFRIDKPISIGIIGGGQLGKMIAQEAKRMSIRVIILDPAQDCPASSLADKLVVADFNDSYAIERIAKESDVITFEIELADSTTLERLEMEGYRVSPSASTLRTIQDKLTQRRFLASNNIPVPEFREVNRESLLSTLEEFGYPALLKARRGSYDGRGNFVIKSKKDIEEALEFMSKPSYLEKFVKFTKEVSLMVARNTSGSIESFPLVENIHENNILHMTVAPARVSERVKERARRVAENTMRVLKGAGIFGIEMFVTEDEDVLVNEIAPRPHNSGHYSIEACDISQFEMHIRAILNLPLVKPRLLSPAAMINILADENYDCYNISGVREALAVEGARIHIYGKRIAKRGRKMGHITVTATDVDRAIERAIDARSKLRILPSIKAKMIDN